MIPGTIATKLDESVGQLTEVADKLTASIQAGNKEKARAFLEDLINAQPKLDIKITVPVSDNILRKQENEFSVRVHVEDREAAGGVFIMKVRSCDTIFDLKRKFLLQYDLPIEVQRWIIGKCIRDDMCSLYSCGVKGPGPTLYLYIVTAHSVGLTPEAFEANRRAYVEGRFPLPMNPQLSTSSDGSLLASTLSVVTGKPSSPGLNSQFLDSQFPPDNTEKSPPFMMSPWTSQDPNNVDVGLLEAYRSSNITSAGVTSAIPSSLTTRQSGDSGIDNEYSPENSSQISSPPLVTVNVLQNSPLSEETENTGWDCPKCTFRNLPTRPGCAMCSTSRPEAYEVPPGYQMTPEELLRQAVDDEMERKTREPGSFELTYDQEQDNLLLQLTQEGIDPQQFPIHELDEEGFQIIPQSILHEQSYSNIPSNPDSVVPRGQTQMPGPPLESSNRENLLVTDGEDGNHSGDSSKA